VTDATTSLPQQPAPARRRSWKRVAGAPLAIVDGLDPARLVPQRIRERSTWIGAVASLALITTLLLWEYSHADEFGFRFDWMLVSGYATAIVGLWFARPQPDRFADAARRLADRGALVVAVDARRTATMTGDDLERVVDEVQRRARRNGHRLGLAAAIATGIVFHEIYEGLWWPGSREPFYATALGAATAYMVGRALGRTATFGFLRSPLLAGGRTVRADPGHLDGAAGLKPLGDFYFSQALLLLIPGAFLLVWTLLLRDDSWRFGYGQWEEIFQGLLVVVVLLQLTVFVTPMVGTHLAMKHQKRERLRAADARGAEIRRLREELTQKLSAEDRNAVQEQLEAVIARYREVDTMPTWPVPRPIWRGFALQSFALATPFVADLVSSVATA
jgi:hypothetical protein